MEYLPVFILLIAGIAVGGGAVIVSRFLGPKLPGGMKDKPFECGVPTVGDVRQRISVRFYLVAILFLLFDVEVAFFFPWAVVYKKYLGINAFILIEMATFVGFLLVGYLYILRKGALDWD